MCHIFDESDQSLPQRGVVRRFSRVVDEKELSELTAECLTNRLGHPFDLGGQLEGGMEKAIGELSKGEPSPKTLLGTVEPVGQYPFCLIRRGNGQSGWLKL